MGSTEIVKADLEGGLAHLRADAESLVVKDQAGYLQACEIALAARRYIKDVGFKLDPGIESAREHLNTLRNQKAQYVDPAEQIAKLAAGKGAAWKEEERRKALAEQNRINEERRIEAAKKAEEERKERERQAEIDRKAREKEIEAARKAGEIKAREAARLKKEAEEAAARERARAAEDERLAKQDALMDTVTVKPAVPTVAGIRARVQWKFRITNPSKLPRQYLMADEVAIGQEVRRLKDKAKAEAAIPGIEVYSEDAI
jgi:uncharacterized protein YhaN